MDTANEGNGSRNTSCRHLCVAQQSMGGRRFQPKLSTERGKKNDVRDHIM